MPTGMAKILDVVAPGITEDLGVTTAPEPATSRRLVRLVDDRGGHLGYVDPDTNRLYTPNLSPSVELIVDPRTGAKRNSKAHLRRKNAARDLGFKP